MGIFSSKKKIHVDTAVVRVIDDSQVPTTHTNAAIKAVLQQKPISQSIQTAMLNGPYQNFEGMYRYAAEPGNYLHGLPDVRSLSSDAGYAEAQAVIEAQVGGPVTVDYLHFRPLNNTHMGWQIATETYGYKKTSNELTVLSTQKGFPVYLEDIVAHYVVPAGEEPDVTSRSAFGDSPRSGYTPSRPTRDAATGLGSLVKARDWTESPTGEEGVTIKYIWEDGTGTVQREEAFQDLSAYDHAAEYYQARYHYVSNSNTVWEYWTYNPEEGLHPALDDTFAYSYTSPGTYFPFVLFRRGEQNFAEEFYKGNPIYDDSEALLDEIGISFADLGAEIYANPDIDQIKQAALMMAVPVNTDNPTEIEYLFRFFTWLEQNTAITPPYPTIEERIAGPGIRANRAIEFKDGGFRVVMSYDEIQWSRHPGSIGPRGTYQRTSVVAENNTTIAAPGGSRVRQTYWFQVSDGVYEKVSVLNPRMQYDIFEDHKVLGNGVDEKCVIPVNHEIAQQISLTKREELYYRSVHLVFNSLVVEKVEWYERGAFKALLVVIAVIIAFKTGYFQGIIDAINLGSLAATAQAVAIMYVKQLVFSYAFELVVNELGLEASLYIALAAAFVGVGLANFATETQHAWAERLLQGSLGLTKGVNTNLATEMAEYQAEAQEFQLLAEQKWEELEEIRKLLDTQDILDPFTFIGQSPVTQHNETPDQMYARTIHSGNLGARGLDFVESFVDISLKLPDIHDSIGDRFYV